MSLRAYKGLAPGHLAEPGAKLGSSDASLPGMLAPGWESGVKVGNLDPRMGERQPLLTHVSMACWNFPTLAKTLPMLSRALDLASGRSLWVKRRIRCSLEVGH